MTRFWITLDQAANFVVNALAQMHGGEIFIPKIPSMRILDLAKLIGPECRHETVGIRPGEKLHESMIEREVGRQALDCRTHYVIQPRLDFWDSNGNGYARMPQCPEGFSYSSDLNDHWVDNEEMQRMILDLNLPDAEDLRERWEKIPLAADVKLAVSHAARPRARRSLR